MVSMTPTGAQINVIDSVFRRINICGSLFKNTFTRVSSDVSELDFLTAGEKDLLKILGEYTITWRQLHKLYFGKTEGWNDDRESHINLEHSRFELINVNSSVIREADFETNLVSAENGMWH